MASPAVPPSYAAADSRTGDGLPRRSPRRRAAPCHRAGAIDTAPWPIHHQSSARLTLVHLMHLYQMNHHFPLGVGVPPFVFLSRNSAVSRICAASIAFSSASVRSLFASAGFVPFTCSCIRKSCPGRSRSVYTRQPCLASYLVIYHLYDLLVGESRLQCAVPKGGEKLHKTAAELGALAHWMFAPFLVQASCDFSGFVHLGCKLDCGEVRSMRLLPDRRFAESCRLASKRQMGRRSMAPLWPRGANFVSNQGQKFCPR